MRNILVSAFIRKPGRGGCIVAAASRLLSNYNCTILVVHNLLQERTVRLVVPDEHLSQHFADAGSADGYGFLHFLRRNDEGGIEIQDVAQGAEQQSPFKGFPVNPVPHPLFGRKAFFGFPVLHQFNGVHQSQAAYFPHVGMIPQGLHDHPAEKRGLFPRPGNDLFLVQDLQHGESGGAPQRIAGIGMAVHECFSFPVVRIKGIVNFLRGDGDGHGHIAAREPFGDAHDVWGNAGLVAGEHAPRAAKTGGDFIRNEVHVVGTLEF